MSTDTSHRYENLIIGSGIAGLMLALKIADKQKVLILSKASLIDNNSFYAQGGLASVLASEDSFEQHIADTKTAGCGLCHPSIVKDYIEDGPILVEKLQSYGVMFDRDKKDLNAPGSYHLSREGGHSQRRVIHFQDQTGAAIVTALIKKVKEHPQIKILDQHTAVDLITSDKVKPSFAEKRCLGAYVLNSENKVIALRSQRTFLCTGGHGRLYLYTSNPKGATGDGLAMAWRAGCRIANLEFMQFHPTCLFHAGSRNFLISEALRGEGAELKTIAGHSFMKDYHTLASLAPRDIVARAIDSELRKSGDAYVLLDIRELGKEKIQKLFPAIYKNCLNYGIDISEECIPVVPAAHYSCGGVVVNSQGKTDLKGLYALGELACTGLHGANRLASNSLLEACAMAERCGEQILKLNSENKIEHIPEWKNGPEIPEDEQVILSHTWDEIRRLMWYYVGIVRSEKRLIRALNRIVNIRQELDSFYWEHGINPQLLEVRNLATVAWLTIRCAIARKESRGTHFTLDFPEAKEEWIKDNIIL